MGEEILKNVRKEEHALRIHFYRDKLVRLCKEVKDRWKESINSELKFSVDIESTEHVNSDNDVVERNNFVKVYSRDSTDKNVKALEEIGKLDSKSQIDEVNSLAFKRNNEKISKVIEDNDNSPSTKIEEFNHSKYYQTNNANSLSLAQNNDKSIYLFSHDNNGSSTTDGDNFNSNFSYESSINNFEVLELQLKLEESRKLIEKQYELKMRNIYKIKRAKGIEILKIFKKLKQDNLVTQIKSSPPVLLVFDEMKQTKFDSSKAINKNVRFISQEQHSDGANTRPSSVNNRINSRNIPDTNITENQHNQQNSKRRHSSVGRGGPSATPSGLNYHKLSNMQQVKNALNNVCLAGSHFDSQRIEACDAIDSAYFDGLVIANNLVKISQFIILFYHSKSLAFRGIYGVIPQSNDLLRIYGKGIKEIKENMIESYWKYSTSNRGFEVLPSKSLTSTTDAVSIDPSKNKNK